MINIKYYDFEDMIYDSSYLRASYSVVDPCQILKVDKDKHFECNLIFKYERKLYMVPYTITSNGVIKSVSNIKDAVKATSGKATYNVKVQATECKLVPKVGYRYTPIKEINVDTVVDQLEAAKEFTQDFLGEEGK